MSWHLTLTGAPPGQDPILADQVHYHARKRDLMQCIADETGDAQARQSLAEANETLKLLQ